MNFGFVSISSELIFKMIMCLKDALYAGYHIAMHYQQDQIIPIIKTVSETEYCVNNHIN